MKKLMAILVCLLIVAGGLDANANQVVKNRGYQISIPPGWARTKSVPQGIDVGFTKKLAQGQYATFFFHHEVMPAEAGEPPSDTSAMKRQWDTMLRNQYPDVRSIAGVIPRVGGKILVNGTYELTDGGKKVQRRYTYFLAGRTAFVVQCNASPGQWAGILADFNTMLASLQPRDSAPETKTKSDKSVKAELKRNIPTLLGSFKPQWRCSLSKVTLSSFKGTRTLEIALRFDRSDIVEIYKATKIIFDKIKAGKSGSDLNKLPPRTKSAASSSGEFMQCVGQVWGLAWYYVANCNPAIGRYKIPILNSKGHRVGSVSISKEDGSAILTGKVTASDTRKVASVYVFE